MRLFRPLALTAFLGLMLPLQAQKLMDLSACIEFAWQNSLQIKRSELSLRQAQLNHKQARWAQYPSLNANLRHGVNVGRSVDLTSYQFVNQAMQATNLSINLNVPLYNGLQLRHNIQQRQVEIEAGQQDLVQVRNDLALSIAQAYLSILMTREQLEVLQTRKQLSEAQLEQSLKLIKAGSLPENNRYDLEAQLAQDEQNIVNAQNSLDLAYLNLKIALNYPLNETLEVKRMELGQLPSAELLDIETLYQEALNLMPSLRAAQLRERSADLGIISAKGALQPSISLFSSIGSNYSSLGQRYSGDSITVNQTFQGDLGGTPFTLVLPTSIPARERSPYFAQMKDNFTQAIGINVQVPILNGLQARLNIERAELNKQVAKMSTEQLQVQLKSDISRALADAKAAEKRLQAAERSAKATRIAAENTRKRYDIGVVNAFELSSVQNNLTAIESNLVQAKFDYVFRLKILDYYRGKMFE